MRAETHPKLAPLSSLYLILKLNPVPLGAGRVPEKTRPIVIPT